MKKLLTVLCAVFVVFASANRVEAANYTPINGTTTTLQKCLVVDADAEIPASSFPFTIAPGAAVAASATTMPVYAGTTPATVTSTISFTAGEATTAGAASDGIANSTSKKYACKVITADFTGATYSEPGVYRYVITEGTGTNSAVVNDTVATRTVDVQVIDNNGALQIAGYAVYSGTVTAGPALSGTNAGTKSNRFVNNYTSNSLTIGKTVSGAGGSVDQYFKFTVNITGAGAGTVMTLDMSGAETSTHANNATTYTTTVMNTANTKDDDNSKAGQQLVANSSGEVTFDVYLHHGQSIVVKGVPNGASYTVTEAEANANGYTTTGQVTTATAVATAPTATITNARAWTPATGLNRYYRDAFIVTGCSVAAMVAWIVIAKKKKENEATE